MKKLYNILAVITIIFNVFLSYYLMAIAKIMDELAMVIIIIIDAIIWWIIYLVTD